MQTQLSVIDVFNQQFDVISQAVKEVAKHNNGSRLRVAVTGHDHEIIARTALALMDDDHQVILLPKQGMAFPKTGIDIGLNLNRTQVDIDTKQCSHAFRSVSGRDGRFENDWDIVMYTSGTTGNAKPIGLKKAHLDYTVERYREIYGTDADTLILSSLPASYNFTFISAAYQAKKNGHAFKIVGDYDIVPEIKKAKDSHSKVIVVANPVVLQMIAGNMKDIETNLLVDSGGAPLSKTAIQQFREAGIDLREGYGLTETSSLTHFDSERIDQSIGTVGKPVEGVSHRVENNKDGKPVLIVSSPNIGVNLMEPPNQWPQEINTGDIVRVDQDDRVQLLGRERDSAINGFWPRDTLDLIGPALGKRCAGVRHFPEGRVWVRVLGDLEDVTRREIGERVVDSLAIPPEDFYIDAYSDALLHSIKLPAPGV